MFNDLIAGVVIAELESGRELVEALLLIKGRPLWSRKETLDSGQNRSW